MEHRATFTTALLAACLLLAASVSAQGLSGKWQGMTAPNIGRIGQCDPTLKWSISVANGQLTGNFAFTSSTRSISATVAPDGTFATTYKNGRGEPVEVKGKLGDTFSVNNPAACGYGGMSLKK